MNINDYTTTNLLETNPSIASELASLIEESPNPVFRLNFVGEIIYSNLASRTIQNVEYESLTFQITDFWKYLVAKYGCEERQIVVINNDNHFAFHIIKSLHREELYAYGKDITERIHLEQRASENFFRLSNFLESTQDGYFLIYKNHQEKNYVTSKCFSFFGLVSATDDFLEKKRALIDVQFKDAYDNAWEQLILKGDMSVVYKIKKPGQIEDLWVKEEMRRIYDYKLKDELISGRVTDVSKEQLYKLQIEESENRFKLIAEHIPVILWVSNESNYVYFSNKQAKTFFGKALSDFTGAEEYSPLVHPEDRGIAIDNWKVELKSRKPFQSQYRIKNASGDYRWLLEMCVPRFFQDGSFLGYIGVSFDITEEKNIQLKLDEERKKYAILSEYSYDMVFLLDENGTIEYTSPSVKNFLSKPNDNLLGTDFFSLIYPQNTITMDNFLRNKELQIANTISFQMLHGTKGLVWMEATFNLFKNDDDQRIKIITHIRDINEQHIAQNLLIENESKYRKLFDMMNLGVLEVDTKETIMYANPAMTRITQYEFNELVGKNAENLLLDKSKDGEIFTAEQKRRNTGLVGIYEIHLKRKDGKFATVNISGAPVYDLKGNINGSVGIHWDVTAIREMEKELIDEKLNKEKQLMEARLQAEEEQRAAIGVDLHDGVGQMLAYLNLYLSLMREKEKIEITDIIKVQDNIEKTVNEVRRLARNLTPPAINDLGFKEAVIELVNSFAILPTPAFTLKIYKGKDPDNMDKNRKLMLYRLIQELSSNTFKYAKASKVLIEISLQIRENKIEMMYNDDGVGFDFKKSIKGVGLRSIQSRVEFYKGKFSYVTSPNNGFTALITMPIGD
jgi:PAS domain S-box-containing protein